MGHHMKTTLDLPDGLLLEAKKAAIDRATTLKALVESGLRRELAVPAARCRGVVARLRAVDRGVWDDVNADHYVTDQRAGWE